MKYTLESAKEELREINNVLSLYHKKRRAIQNFIEEENDRLKGIASKESKAWELQNDPKFVAEYGRERTAKEVARIMKYSERQVQRFLDKKKEE